MSNDDYIRNQFLEIEINQTNADISKLPTEEILKFRKSLTANYNKAVKTGEYKKQMEEMLKKFETYIINDKIEQDRVLSFAAKCGKQLEESIL